MTSSADENDDGGGGGDALWRKIRTEGVQLAYDTAVAICRDRNAPAPAKATALTALFRVAGYFSKPDTGDDKEPHEMNAEELSASIRRLREQAQRSGASVFD